MKTSAIVLCAGSGSRMQSRTKKQYMLLDDKPVIYYSLKAFEDSFIDEIILVTSKADISYVKSQIIDRYGFTKISRIVSGGEQRYNSVLNGLMAIDESDYVFIHDGARPMLNQEILLSGLEAVKEYEACVIGMPSKDTVKISSDDGFVINTPNRECVWNVQTPQIFRFDLIKEAYKSVVSKEDEYKNQGINITDDAMVLELYCNHKIKLVKGTYENIKITTPEDMILCESFIKEKRV